MDSLLLAEGLVVGLPVLLCLGSQVFSSSKGNSSVRSVPRSNEIDQWYIPEDIKKVYANATQEIDSWRKEATDKELEKDKKLGFFSRKKKKQERLIVDEEIPPRLIRILDYDLGEITFEFTESMGMGTSLRVSYNSILNDRIQRFRAKSNAKLPLAFTFGEPCRYCGHPVFRDTVICPNCGKKLI